MVKKILLWVVSMVMAAHAMAYDMVGEVRDRASHRPLDFVNVSVLRQGETTPQGTVTDADGLFAITGLVSGTYTVTISFIGYEPYTHTIHLRGADHDMGHIYLSEDTQALQEVEVVGQGSTVRFELDRKVFSVDQDLAAAGASASEALENLPAVDMDQEGNISLRGSESVEIWINGKPSGLTAENRADILRQMPAESIKEIEVITNPSARFSPEGSSGVINIVMKKDRKPGYYGSWTVGMEYGLAEPWTVPPGANTNLNLNFSKGIVDGYVNVGYRYHTRNGRSFSERYMLDGQGSRYMDDIRPDSIRMVLNSKGQANSQGHGLNLRAGINLHLSEHSTLGFSGFGILSEPSALHGYDKNTTDLLQTDYHTGDTLRNYRRTESGGGWHPGGNAMVDYQFNYHKHKLSLEGTYNHWQWNNDQRYTTNEQKQTTSDQLQQTRNRDQSVECKANYEWKPTQQSRLEAGYQMRWSDRYTLSEAQDKLQGNTEIYDFYSDFRTREQNHALYISYGNKFWNRFSMQVGLRGELQTRHMDSYYKDHTGTVRDAYQETGSNPDTLYLQLYPSVYLSYDFGNGHELQLNYTRRVDRPWGHTLNPRQNIADSTNISCGNPELLPSYSNNMELNYLKLWERHSISAGVFWRYKEKVVQNLSFVDGAIMRNTWVNAGNRHELGGDISVKNRLFGELLQLTTSLECYYNAMNGGEYTFRYAGRPQTVMLAKQSTVTWSAKMQLNFLFTKTFSGQLSGRYRSPRVLAQGYTTHSYNIDLGLRKTFLDKKLALSFNVRDVLDSRARRSIKWGEGFREESERRWHSRTVSMTLTYNFGNMKKKNEKNLEHSMDASAGAFDDGAGAEGGNE